MAAAAQSRRGGGAVAGGRGRAVRAPISRVRACCRARPGWPTCCCGARSGRSGRSAARPVDAAARCDHPGMDPARRVRWLRGLLIVIMLVFVMVGVSSTDAVDVIYAVMEGATTADPRRPAVRAHAAGDHPRRHLSDPQLRPVYAARAGRTGELDMGLGRRWARGRRARCARARPGRCSGSSPAPARGRASEAAAEDEEAGLRAALAVAGVSIAADHRIDGNDRRGARRDARGRRPALAPPALCAGMLAIAGWFKLAPFALVPVSLAPLRGRRLVRALAAIGLVSLPMLALLVALGGLHGPAACSTRCPTSSRAAPSSRYGACSGSRALQPFGQGVRARLIVGAALRLRPSRCSRRPAANGCAGRGDPDRAAARGRLLGVPVPRLVVPLVGLSLLADRDARPGPLSLACRSAARSIPAPAIAA